MPCILKPSRSLFVLFAVSAFLNITNSAQAQAFEHYWNVGAGDWSSSASWLSGAVPQGNEIAYVRNGGSAIVTNGGTIGDIYLGEGGSGTVITTGGSFSIGSAYVGAWGTGTFMQAGGTVNVQQNLNLGNYPFSSGSFFLSGGRLSAAYEYVGKSYASGLFVQTGGVHEISGALYVGFDNGNGSYLLNGGSLRSAASFIGQSGAGSVTVSGANSVWTNAGSLYVGSTGTGTLNITNSGSVVSLNGSIGEAVQSEGVVTVVGSGSTWTIDDQLCVGMSGAGKLTISDGGAVKASIIDINGNCESVGVVTVSGTNSALTTSSVLRIGLCGGGTLNIVNGAKVVSEHASLGFEVGSKGTVNVAGFGSLLSVQGLDVGQYLGQASLVVSDGGTVTSDWAGVGYCERTGNVSVSGTGSQWINRGNLWISQYGAIEVTSGGLVSSGTASVFGTVSVHGNNSRWTTNDQTTTWNGSLDVYDGAEVTGGDCFIGYGEGMNSRVTVSGSGSKLTSYGTLSGLDNFSFRVGYYGTGTLEVTGGGAVVAFGQSCVGYNNYFGSNINANGAITVTGTGSRFDCFDSLTISNGTLEVKDGGSVAVSKNVYVDGPVSVSGSSSTLTVGGTLTVYGTFNQYGGTVIAPKLEIYGVYNLAGGALDLAKFGGSYPNPIFLNGGTLRASSNLRVEASIAGTATFDSGGHYSQMLLYGEGKINKTGEGTLAVFSWNSNGREFDSQQGTLILCDYNWNHSHFSNIHTAAGATVQILGKTSADDPLLIDSITGEGTTQICGDTIVTIGVLVQDTLILGGEGDDEPTFSASLASFTAVPEPTTWAALLAAGCVAIFSAAKKRKDRSGF